MLNKSMQEIFEENLEKSLSGEFSASDFGILDLQKAIKGTPGYDKWLQNYRAKHPTLEEDPDHGDDYVPLTKKHFDDVAHLPPEVQKPLLNLRQKHEHSHYIINNSYPDPDGIAGPVNKKIDLGSHTLHTNINPEGGSFKFHIKDKDTGKIVSKHETAGYTNDKVNEFHDKLREEVEKHLKLPSKPPSKAKDLTPVKEDKDSTPLNKEMKDFHETVHGYAHENLLRKKEFSGKNEFKYAHASLGKLLDHAEASGLKDHPTVKAAKQIYKDSSDIDKTASERDPKKYGSPPKDSYPDPYEARADSAVHSAIPYSAAGHVLNVMGHPVKKSSLDSLESIDTELKKLKEKHKVGQPEEKEIKPYKPIKPGNDPLGKSFRDFKYPLKGIR